MFPISCLPPAFYSSRCSMFVLLHSSILQCPDLHSYKSQRKPYRKTWHIFFSILYLCGFSSLLILGCLIEVGKSTRSSHDQWMQLVGIHSLSSLFQSHLVKHNNSHPPLTFWQRNDLLLCDHRLLCDKLCPIDKEASSCHSPLSPIFKPH